MDFTHVSIAVFSSCYCNWLTVWLKCYCYVIGKYLLPFLLYHSLRLVRSSLNWFKKKLYQTKISSQVVSLRIQPSFIWNYSKEIVTSGITSFYWCVSTFSSACCLAAFSPQCVSSCRQVPSVTVPDQISHQTHTFLLGGLPLLIKLVLNNLDSLQPNTPCLKRRERNLTNCRSLW